MDNSKGEKAMKTVLILMAALFLTASVSQGAILEAWLQFVTKGSVGDQTGYDYDTWKSKVTLGTGLTKPTTAYVGKLYSVEMWLRIVADPNIPGEDVSNTCINSTAFTICGLSSTIVTEPNALGNDTPTGVGTPGAGTLATPDVGFIAQDIGSNAPGARQPATTGKYFTPPINNGGMASVETSIQLNYGVGFDGADSTMLVAVENWMLESWTHADLYLSIAPSSQYWDTNTPGVQYYFSQIETGTMSADGTFTQYVPGTDIGQLWVGPLTPEPATLALLGFGAVATLLRRRNKK